MVELPENFPEFSIMHKTLTKQIEILEKELEEKQESVEIKLKIQNYKAEIDRIEKKFPDNFFKELS